MTKDLFVSGVAIAGLAGLVWAGSLLPAPAQATPVPLVNKPITTKDLGHIDCRVFYKSDEDHSLALVCELPDGLQEVPSN